MTARTVVFGIAFLFCAASGCTGAEPQPADTASPAADSTETGVADPRTDHIEGLPNDLGTRHTGEDWPRFLGPTGDSKSAETGVIAPWPAGGPRLVWNKRIATTYAMPVISRGRIFRFERVRNQNTLVCEKSETGEPIWKFEYPTDYEDYYGYNNGPRCSPVVDGARVYIYGQEGMLHCVSVHTGKALWKVDTFERFGVEQNFFGVGSTPIIEGDLLIVQVGGSKPSAFGALQGNGSGVVAFNKFTGEVVYQTSDELASYASPIVATIDNRRVGLLFARGGLLAFDARSGKQTFHFPWRSQLYESVNASNPVVVDDLVFLSECYGPGSVLLRVAGGKPEVVWSDLERRRNKSMQTHWNTPIHHEGYVYGSSGRHSSEAELRAIELATGKVMWSEPGFGRASLLYVDGYFIVLCESGELLLIRATPEKFDLVSRVRPTLEGRPLITPPAWAAPILSHGLLYVQGDDRLACFELISKP